MKSRLLLLLLTLAVLPGVFAADAPVPATAPMPASAPIVSGGAAYAAVPRNSNGIYFHEGGAQLPAYLEVARNEAPSTRDARMKWFHEARFGNSECIYSTRPWMIYGEGLSVKNDATAKDSAGNPPRGLGPNLTASDIRFTTKGDVLYAAVMGWPEGGKTTIKALATNSPNYKGGIGSVQMLGSSGNLEIARDENGLTVTLPAQRTKTDDYGIALEIILKA